MHCKFLKAIPTSLVSKLTGLLIIRYILIVICKQLCCFDNLMKVFPHCEFYDSVIDVNSVQAMQKPNIKIVSFHKNIDWL